jgi:hypothetical protein
LISAGPGVPASSATSSLSPVERRPSSSAASAAFLLELGHAVNALRSIPAVEETNNGRVPDLTAGGVRYSSWWWWIDGEAAVSSPRYIKVNASEARMIIIGWMNHIPIRTSLNKYFIDYHRYKDNSK